MLFFVAVGMLFDPAVLISNPLPVLATVLIIVVGKSVLAFGIVIAFRMPVSTALVIAVSLAQVGEFSFILAELGVGLGILPEEGRDLILGGAIISIVLNPLAFWLADRLTPKLETALAVVPTAGSPAEPVAPTGVQSVLSGHSVIVGYGRVGRVVAERLAAAGHPFVVIEDAEDPARDARALGYEVVEGNPAGGEALALANIAGARHLFVAIPNAFEAGQVIEQARKANPGLMIVARAHSDEEAEYLRGLGADHVIIGEREIAIGMADHLKGTEPPSAVT